MDVKVCTLCGQTGHRAHACSRRPVTPNWPFPRSPLDYPGHPPAHKPAAQRTPRAPLPDDPAPF